MTQYTCSILKVYFKAIFFGKGEIRCTLIQLAGNQFNFGYVIVRQQLFITRTIIRLERTPIRLNYDERNAKENEKYVSKKANI